MVSGTISLFCSKCFSPFLHSTGSLSVSREYLALPDGPGRFTQNSSCSALLRIPLGFAWLRIRSCHALWLYFPEHSAHQLSCHGVVLQPHPCRNMGGLGCSPFARHYWGNHCLFSFPAGTKMFQFPALAFHIVEWYLFKVPGCPIRKSADQRSFAPTRSLSRPSSPPRAKASAMCPYLLFVLPITYGRYILSAFNFTFFWSHHVKERCFNYKTIIKTEWRITDSNR